MPWRKRTIDAVSLANTTAAVSLASLTIDDAAGNGVRPPGLPV